MEIGPELTALIDRLCAQHPGFRRPTVERLVLRSVAELHVAELHGDGGAVPPAVVRDLAAVHDLAAEQLDYVEEGDPDRLDGPQR